MILLLTGCGAFNGYSNDPLFTPDVQTIYVEMFENNSFYRGVEYHFSDAVAKKIEAETPYKIVSDRNKADSIIGGKLVEVQKGLLTSERETGRALESDITLQVVVNWKNLKTGQLLLDNQTITASASFSEWQGQSFEYGSTLAANKLANRVVQSMAVDW